MFHPKMPHESMLINLCEAAAANESHDWVDIMGVVVDYSLRRRRQGGSDPITSAAVWIVDNSFSNPARPAVISIRGQFLSLLLTCSRQSTGEMPWTVGDIVRFNQVRKTTTPGAAIRAAAFPSFALLSDIQMDYWDRFLLLVAPFDTVSGHGLLSEVTGRPHPPNLYCQANAATETPVATIPFRPFCERGLLGASTGT
jgi:hypothetical protein